MSIIIIGGNVIDTDDLPMDILLGGSLVTIREPDAALAVTDGVTTVENVSTLTAPSVQSAGAGEATLGPISGSPAAIYYGEEDPGAVGAGAIWVRPAGSDGSQVAFRNAADTAWGFGLLVQEEVEAVGGLFFRTNVSSDPRFQALVYGPGEPDDRPATELELRSHDTHLRVFPDEFGGTRGFIRISSPLSSFGLSIALALLNANGEDTTSLELVEDGGIQTIRMLGLPSVDPEVAGALYTAGAPGPADPKALMVSGGPA